MTRMSLSPLKLFTLAVALLLALCACSRQSQAPQQSAQSQAAQQSPTQADATAAPPDSTQPSASEQTSPTASSSASSTQAADGSSSLEHLAGLSNGALPASSEWKPNVNYDVISPAQSTTVAPGKVEVLEVFWLACPHCFAMEPYIRQWLKTKPAYVDYVRVPVMWGPVHRAHAQLFYTLESLGRDDLVEKAFAYLHDLEGQTGNEDVLFANSPGETFQEQQAWAVQNGIGADAFAKAYNSFYVSTQLQQAEEITNDYEVQGVPYFAIDGKFSTDVGKAGSPNQLISLITFLAAWEHDHQQGAG